MTRKQIGILAGLGLITLCVLGLFGYIVVSNENAYRVSVAQPSAPTPVPPNTTQRGSIMFFLEMIAALALLIGDALAVFSVVGSAVMLVGTGISLATGRRRFKASEQIFLWAWGGFILGVIGLVSLILTGNQAEQIGFIFRLSKSTIGILLFVSFLLLVARTILALIIRPKE